jgi:hypothetical protein
MLTSVAKEFVRPGPPETRTGAKPTYFVPWKVGNSGLNLLISIEQLQDHVPLGEKLDVIMSWIDLPLDMRPRLILGESLFSFFGNECVLTNLEAYEPTLDQAGHAAGPYSKMVNASLLT